MLKKLASIILALFFLAQPVIAAAPPPPIEKGLAQLDWSHNSDRALLGVTQFYAWGMNSCGGVYTNCVPMNRNWEMSAQTFCPPQELLGNEPTNPEPAGHPISANVAASVTVAIEQACPSTVLVVGNVHLNNGNGEGDKAWIISYLASYKALTGHAFGGPNRLGVHCYSGGGQRCLDRIKAITNVYPGPLWVTEFGILSPEQLTIFLNGIGFIGRVERIYAWTNRDAGDPNHFYDLVNADGVLTALGTVYANWSPPVIQKTFVPIISGPCLSCQH